MADSEATYTRNVLVDLPDRAAEVVTFHLLSYFAAAGNEGFPQKTYTLTLDENGTGTQALPVPDNTGDVSWLWKITTPDGNGYKATLAYGSDIQLTAWLASALSSETAASIADQFVLKDGDTMTGLLQFSGTDHAGIKLLSLTTAERDALTPAEGMVIYNETTATVQVYQGGAWAGVSGISEVVEDTTPQLGGDLDAQGNDITSMGDITFQTGATGGTLRTGASNADKFILAAYDVNDGVYRTVIELDAGNDVVMQLIADYLQLEDAADPTKHVEWDLSGATGSTATTLIFSQTVSRNITFPDEAGTIALSANVLPKDAGILSKSSSYPIAAGDEGKNIEVTATATITCPDGLDSGFQVVITSIGGTTTLLAATTLQYLDGGAQTAASGVTVDTQVVVYHRGSNVWLVTGGYTVL